MQRGRQYAAQFDANPAGNVHFNIWWFSVRLREHACRAMHNA
jgi:hypothetical protein